MDASQKNLPFTVDFNLILGPTFIDFVFVAKVYIYRLLVLYVYIYIYIYIYIYRLFVLKYV
jgi:hypothetical protein